MEHEALLRRVEDLLRRCEKSNILTATAFLTPAEQAAVVSYVNRLRGCRMLLSGGQTDCERKAAFFLPDWMEEEDFAPAGSISALRIEASYGNWIELPSQYDADELWYIGD